MATKAVFIAGEGEALAAINVDAFPIDGKRQCLPPLERLKVRRR
jgi:hypothetical protein